MPPTQRRVAVVTGAARGLGAATAQRLAEDGHAVAILDLDEAAAIAVADEIRANGGHALPVAVDVADPGAVDAAVRCTATELGPPTILVSNAGITRDSLLFKMSEQDWDAVLDVHLKGAFLTTRATQKYMVEAGFGRIVTLSSTSALGNRGQVNYAAAKAGLQGFTKTLAIELGKFGITANAVAPGFIHTDMNRAVAKRLAVPWDEYSASMVRTIPVARPGQPEDVANAVSFFTSDAAGFVSGQFLYVAGGPTA
ncbi:MAG TPA: SDR family NAD(P)-dependent oxidoreductase [Amycolatopsis sp.]|nr:SDR family NAD(P)-dependent oxidoreductase [Amycolatopsis sp.]